MKKKVEAFRWKFYDTMLRTERLTSDHMTRAEAAQRYPTATAELRTREVRYVDSQTGEFDSPGMDSRF